MKKRDWDWIDNMTLRFHKRTGFYPDKEEVIRQIRLYRREVLLPPRKGWTKHQVKKRSIERFVMTECIRRINLSEEGDPIWILMDFKSEADDMIVESDHSATWMFSSAIFDAIRDFLEFLG